MAKKAKTAEKAEDPKTLVVTQEILDLNPELVDQEVAVGDEIEMNDDLVMPKEVAKTAKSKGGAVAILKGDNFIRIYTAEQSDLVAEFLTKDPAYTSIPVESLKAINVPYTEEEKGGVVKRLTKVFSASENSRFIEDAISFKNDKRSSCIAVLAK